MIPGLADSRHLIILSVFLFVNVFCVNAQSSKTSDTLPPPFATKSKMNFSKVVGWKNGAKPIAPAGFEVTEYAGELRNPRWMHVLPNGDVLIAESNTRYGLLKRIAAFFVGAHRSNSLRKSADRITLLRDQNKDGKPDERIILLKNLNQPFGMLMLDNELYVANTNGVLKYGYKPGANTVEGNPEKIVDLPAGKINQHWPRNLLADKSGKKLFITVGSGDDHGEKGMENEVNRACILRINKDGSGLEVFASGLRNPNGMAWAPGTDDLYTVVNERDLLGDDLVPDYLTSVKENGFYGWPYTYFGQHVDPRVPAPKPELVEKTIVPDLEIGAHTASLGLQFYTGSSFPEKYRNGAFIAQHGSWNRSVLSGYKVIFVPFENGKPKNVKEDFLTGFISDLKKDKVHGRPVGLAQLPDGSLLVSDDRCNRIWRVAYK